MIRLIIAGSRSFSDNALAEKELNKRFLNERPDVVISGCAPEGADPIGTIWAKKNGIPVEPHPAKWRTYGKSAGMIRNGEMAKVATHLVAFWDGKSTGTENMIERARKRGLNVTVIDV